MTGLDSGTGQAPGEAADRWGFLFFSSPGHAAYAGGPDTGDWQL